MIYIFFMHLFTSLWCFCPKGNRFNQRIKRITMGLLYIRFTCQTKENLQKRFRHINWLSMLYLVTWINHLSPAWWSVHLWIYCFKWQLECNFRMKIDICYLFSLYSFYFCMYYPGFLHSLFLESSHIYTTYYIRPYAIDVLSTHLDDVIKWKHYPRYWPFVRGIHRSPVKTQI